MTGELSFSLQHTWEVLLAALSAHESLLIFFAILVEESGIPMPLPADLAMALAGYRVAQGQMSLLKAFLIGQLATLLGSSVLYWVGRRGGRPLIFRYGKVLHVNAHRLAQVERLVTRLGPCSVIIGRQIPGLRLAAPLACGVFRIRYRHFLPAMFVGASLYIAIFMVIGLKGGPAMMSAVRLGALPLRFVASSVLLLLASALLRQLSRRARDVVPLPEGYRGSTGRREVESAILAGLGASALMGLVVRWSLMLVGIVAQAPPEHALLQWLSGSTTAGGAAVPALAPDLSPQRLIFTGLLATFPFEIGSHLVWALVYAFAFEPRLRGPASIRGLQFATLPWLFSCLVIFPLFGIGPFGLWLHTPLAMLGELTRLALFGAVLGTLYRLLRLSRQPRLLPGHRHGHRHRPALPAAGQHYSANGRAQAAVSRSNGRHGAGSHDSHGESERREAQSEAQGEAQATSDGAWLP